MMLLYVDDDREDVYLFTEAVRTLNIGYTCVHAGNGEEALEKLKTLTPDCIVLDVNMPRMNGKEALREIRKNQAHHGIPVIMFSTTIDPKDREVYERMGADECLIKPTSFQELCNLIQGLRFTRR